MSLTLILVAGGLGVAMIVLIVIALSAPREDEEVAVRLEEFASRSTPPSLEELELAQPFRQRIVLPILRGLAGFVTRFTPSQTMQATRLKLDLAGRPNNWGPTEFFGVRMVAAIMLSVLFFLLVTVAKQGLLMALGGLLLGLLLGFMLPSVWLGGKIRKRQGEIIKAMPDALDLLTICVEAGLGFDAAMAKIAEKWDNALSNAFARVIQEIRLGKTRREALREMERTAGVPDVTSFVAAVIQADQLGVSMSKVMRIQSEQMRIRRRQRAEEKAHQAPIKMLFPLVFLIFPAIYIVLLGPATLVVKEAGLFGGM